MALTAFFMDDVFSKGSTTGTVASFGESAAGPMANALNDRPRVVWQTDTNAYYCIDYGKYLDITEGAGSEVQVLCLFMNGNANQIAAKLQNTLNSNASLNLVYTVLYNPTTGRFEFSLPAGSSDTFAILWGTGTHADVEPGLKDWLGFAKTDRTGGTSYTADEPRYGTDHWVVFNQGDSLFPVTLAACILDGGPEVLWNVSANNTVTIFANSTNLGSQQRSPWVSGAAKTLTFSARPGEDQNRIQVAFDTAGASMNYRHWAFSWRYFDPDPFHAVGLLKGLAKYGSSTRQVAQLKGHGLVDTTRSLNVKSYYPTQNMLRWRAPLAFDNWGATDYRDVVTEVIRNGKAKGLLWALRWSKIADGTYDADDEADKGFLLWAAVQRYGQDAYGGAASDYISGELTLEQVR